MGRKESDALAERAGLEAKRPCHGFLKSYFQAVRLSVYGLSSLHHRVKILSQNSPPSILVGIKLHSPWHPVGAPSRLVLLHFPFHKVDKPERCSRDVDNV